MNKVLVAGVAMSALMLGMVVLSAAPSGAVANPPANIAPNPHYLSTCKFQAGDDNSAACDSAVLAAINAARAQENLGPITLPAGFASMPDEEQLLFIIDRERVDRGLAPFAGTTAQYDSAAVQGANASTDPAGPGGIPPGATSYDEGGVWASQPNVLAADYVWLYEDGFGGAQTVNSECTSAAAPGCWGHRDNILGDYESLPDLNMGAASSPNAADGLPSFAVLFVADNGPTPSYVYTWASLSSLPPPPPAGACSTTVTAPSGPITRIDGAGRDDTAILVSQREFPNKGSAKAVVLASDANFPDALTGGPLAVAKTAPLLITPPTGLASTVNAEIQRVAPSGATVYVLGGTFALSSSVDSQLQSEGYTVTRVAGDNRFATATMIAALLGNPTTIFEASGINFPDALAAGPAAVAQSGVILLTNGSTQAPETTAYVGAHNGKRYAVGGPASQADPLASSIAGSDRYQTAIDVDQMFFSKTTVLGFATGNGYPDALAGGAEIAANGGALVLVPKCPPLQPEVTSYVQSVGAGVKNAQLFGGTFVVDDSTLAALDTAM